MPSYYAFAIEAKLWAKYRLAMNSIKVFWYIIVKKKKEKKNYQ